MSSMCTRRSAWTQRFGEMPSTNTSIRNNSRFNLALEQPVKASAGGGGLFGASDDKRAACCWLLQSAALSGARGGSPTPDLHPWPSPYLVALYGERVVPARIIANENTIAT